MDSNSVDYVLTSPPYNVGGNGLNGEGKKYDLHNDKMSDNDYLNQQVDLINEMLRITKKHIFYNIQMLSGNMGTGTTAIAAIKEKRKWIGSEISSEYYELANKRISEEMMQTQLF